MTDGSWGSLAGIEYAIDRRDGMLCVFCHATDRALLFRKDEPSLGICEPCSQYAGWIWRQLAGEIPPGFPEADLQKVSTACVLIVRRKEIPKLDATSDNDEQIVKAPAELNSSYEFLLEANPDGTCSVPSLPLESHPDRCTCSHCNPYRGDAARSALALLSSIEIRSWSALVEPLYTAYSPRGRLVSVTLIRGWTEVPRGLAYPVHLPLVWRPWPLSEHTGGMAGFWRTMETVWALRLHKHCVAEDAGELCVHLREAACRYIELQAAIRSRQPGAPASDASMLSVYRAAMSVDEVAVERLIQLAENRTKDAKSLTVISTDTVDKRVSSEPLDPGESEDDRKESEDEPNEEWTESDDEDANDGIDDESPAEDRRVNVNDFSFVRPQHPLQQK